MITYKIEICTQVSLIFLKIPPLQNSCIVTTILNTVKIQDLGIHSVDASMLCLLNLTKDTFKLSIRV